MITGVRKGFAQQQATTYELWSAIKFPFTESMYGGMTILFHYSETLKLLHM
jgi:hypothetical protein